MTPISEYTPQEQYRARLKSELLDHYGHACAVCGRNDDAFLTIAPIAGTKLRSRRNQRSGYALMLFLRRRGFPAGFQTVCLIHRRDP